MTESESKSPLVAQTSSVQWLSLKEASELLGVHFTTLRKWSDEGEIRVFRTPGGHRRFSVADLRRFLEDRVRRESPTDAEAFVDAAVGQVRAEIEKLREEHMTWAHSLTLTESARDHTRQRGRQLFSLAIAYVVKPTQRDRLMIEGQRLGFEYGKDAASVGVPLVETGRAVQFFRSQLSKIVRAENSYGLDADDLRIQNAIDHFIDEVLYAVLSGYEQQMTRSASEHSASDISITPVAPRHSDPPPTDS